MILLLAFSANAQAASCAGSTGKTAVDACTAELNDNPKDLKTRHALVSALMSLGRHQEAVTILKKGLALSPGDDTLQSRLKEAQNLVEEQAWIAKQRESSSGASPDTSVKLHTIRCTKLQGNTALAACNAGLDKAPDDITLLVGKADALLELNRVSESVKTYKQALALSPGDAMIKGKLKLAETKRKPTVAKREPEPVVEKVAPKPAPTPAPKAEPAKAEPVKAEPVKVETAQVVQKPAVETAPTRTLAAADASSGTDQSQQSTASPVQSADQSAQIAAAAAGTAGGGHGFGNSPLSPGVTY